MKLTQKTLQVLAQLLLGDQQPQGEERYSPYRTLAQLTEFFRYFGERDLHPRSGAPSRFTYTLEKLEKFNGTDGMAEVICRVLDDLWTERDLNPEHAGAFLNTYLRRDGYEVTIEDRVLSYQGNEAVTEPYFAIRSLRATVVATASLIKLTESSISEHIAKARAKIDAGDYSGAITSSYTLIEGFLKEMLRRLNISFNEDEGNIQKLYGLAAEPLNLSPKGEHLESYLKTILQGLKGQISGLYELANKASDRHARRYNPARHHAKLAVNAAFTLCEFLLDSFEYQQQRQERKIAS
jgi:hypothetical protein